MGGCASSSLAATLVPPLVKERSDGSLLPSQAPTTTDLSPSSVHEDIEEAPMRAPISTSPPRQRPPATSRRRAGKPALQLQLSLSQLSLHKRGFPEVPEESGGAGVGGGKPLAPLGPGPGIARSVSYQIRESNYVAAVETRLLRLCSLGRGSTGSVYKAVDINTLRLVAVKEIHVGGNPKHKAQALEEMTAFMTQRTPLLSTDFNNGGEERCPNILSYYGSSYDDLQQTIAIAVEYEGGGSMADWCENKLPAPEPWLAHIAFSVLKALAFIHERGRIHRDVKPGNLLVGVNGRSREREDSSASATRPPSVLSPHRLSHRPPDCCALPVPPSPLRQRLVGLGLRQPPPPPPLAAMSASLAGVFLTGVAESDSRPPSSGVRRQCTSDSGGGPSRSPSMSPLHTRLRPRSSILAQKADTLTVMLADFGIAKSLGSSSIGGIANDGNGETQYFAEAPRSPTGTRRFMAPERLRLDTYGYSSDVWSLGLTLATIWNDGECPIPHAANEFDQLSHAENLERVIACLGVEPPQRSATAEMAAAAAAGGSSRGDYDGYGWEVSWNANATRGGGGGVGGPDGDAAAGAPLKAAGRLSGARLAVAEAAAAASAAGFRRTLSAEFCDFLQSCLRANPEERPDASELLAHPFLMHRFGWEQRCPEVLAAAEARRRLRASRCDAEDTVRRIVRARLDEGNFALVDGLMDESAGGSASSSGAHGGTAAGIAELAYDLYASERELKDLFKKVFNELSYDSAAAVAAAAVRRSGSHSSGSHSHASGQPLLRMPGGLLGALSSPLERSRTRSHSSGGCGGAFGSRLAPTDDDDELLLSPSISLAEDPTESDLSLPYGSFGPPLQLKDGPFVRAG